MLETILTLLFQIVIGLAIIVGAFKATMWIWFNVVIPIVKMVFCLFIILGFAIVAIFRDVIIDELGVIGFIIIAGFGALAGFKFIKKRNYYR